jgi:hypothetical protein
MVLCAILAASLGTQFLSPGISADDRSSPVRIAALASPSPAIHANSGDRRFESSKHRNTGFELFLPVRAGTVPPRDSRAARATQESRPRPFLAAHGPGGRSPPRNS